MNFALWCISFSLQLLQQSLGANPMSGNLAALPTSPLTNIGEKKNPEHTASLYILCADMRVIQIS